MRIASQVQCKVCGGSIVTIHGGSPNAMFPLVSYVCKAKS